MNGSRHEAITHVLALVAVAVVLILAAAFIASSVSAPSRSSQTAAVSSVCRNVQACNQEGISAEGDILAQQGCQQPGFDYLVRESGGKISVKATAKNPGMCPIDASLNWQVAAVTGRIAAEEPIVKTCTERSLVPGHIPAGAPETCTITYCYWVEVKGADGSSREVEKCHKGGAESGLGDVSLGEFRGEARGPLRSEIMKELAPNELLQAVPQLDLGTLPGPQQQQINNSFLNPALATFNQQKKVNEERIADFDNLIKNPENYGANIPEVNAIKADRDALIKQNAE